MKQKTLSEKVEEEIEKINIELIELNRKYPAEDNARGGHCRRQHTDYRIKYWGLRGKLQILEKQREDIKEAVERLKERVRHQEKDRNVSLYYVQEEIDEIFGEFK